MCRLFGYRSINSEPIFMPLLDNDNALLVQSEEHRDGWGIGFFKNGVPHVVKSSVRAGEDRDFKRLGQKLRSQSVIAHLRRATQGEVSILNCHPFQFGSWLFAHNGDLTDFPTVADGLRNGIAPKILDHVFGNTDSEIYFALFLHELLQQDALDSKKVSIHTAALALKRTVDRIDAVYSGRVLAKPYALNVLIANGDLLIAYRHGHGLYFSAETATEPGYEEGAGIEPTWHKIARLVVCSEPLVKSASFVELQERQMLGIDEECRLYPNLNLA